MERANWPLRNSRREFLGSMGGLVSTGAVSVPGIRSITNPPTVWSFDASADSFAAPLAEGRDAVYVSTKSGLSAVSKSTGSERWYLQADSPFVSPCNVRDRAMYVNTTKNVLAVNARNGREQWRFEGGNVVRAAGDAVYVVDASDSVFVALTPRSGTERWQFENDDDLFPTITLGESEVYTSTWHGTVRALSHETGTVQWKSDLSNGGASEGFTGVNTLDVVTTEPGRVETLYVWATTEDESTLYALSTDDGTERWRTVVGRGAYPFPVTITDRTVVLSDERQVQTLSPTDGTIRWQHDESRKLNPSVTVTDEFVLSATTSGEVQARSITDGAKLWASTTGPNPQLASAVDGTVIVSSGRKVFTLSEADGEQKWVFEAEGRITRPPIVLANNTVCFGTEDGIVYVVNATTGTFTGMVRNNVGVVLAGGLLGCGLLAGIYAKLQQMRSVEASKATAFEDFELVERVETGKRVERYRVREQSTVEDSEMFALERFEAGDSKTEEFSRVARAVAKIEHESVVSLRCWGTNPDPWVVIESRAASSLDEFLNALDTETCVKVMTTTSEAIHCAHKNGVAHTRLCPELIRVPDDVIEQVQVDGWVRSVYCPIEDSGRYTAPEQVDASTTAHPKATDIFQLGAITYRLLTGRRPVKDPSASEYEFVPPSDFNPQVSSHADDVLAVALNRDPQRRYDSALEYRDALRWAVLVNEK